MAGGWGFCWLIKTNDVKKQKTQLFLVGWKSVDRNIFLYTRVCIYTCTYIYIYIYIYVEIYMYTLHFLICYLYV